MPRVLIRCPRTGKAIRTGIAVNSQVTFDAKPIGKRSLHCPHCRDQHVWSKEDAFLEQQRRHAPRGIGLLMRKRKKK